MLHLSSSNNRIDLNFMANFTNLILCLPSLSAAYTKYLLYYLPAQLTVLHIEMIYQNIFKWVGGIGIKHALNFFEKIGRIEETNIAFRFMDRYEVQTNEETLITIYFKLLNAFKGTRQTCSTAFFSDVYDGFAREHSFCCDHDGNLSIKYTICDNDLDDPDFRNPIFDLILSDMTSSVIRPEIFDYLYFHFTTARGDLLYQVLNYSIVNFPKLQKSHLLCGNFEIGQTASEILYYHDKSLLSSNTTNCDINFFKMIFINLDQSYFDLVSVDLPNIEAISLTTPDLNGLDDNYVIDLTSFKNLKTISYYIQIYSSRNNDDQDGNEYQDGDDYQDSDNDEDRDNDFVLLKYSNGKDQCHYLDEKKRRNCQIEYIKNPIKSCLTVLCDVSVSFHFQKMSTDKRPPPPLFFIIKLKCIIV